MSLFAAIAIAIVVVIVLVIVLSCLVTAKHADQIQADLQRDDIERLRRMKGAA